MRHATLAEGNAGVDAVTDAVLTASRLLIGLSARSIAAVEDSITLPQFRLLVVLHTRGPLRHSTLAEHLGVTPSTASRMVDRLVATDMVRRDASPNSRREIMVELTTDGRQVVRQVTARRRKEIAKIVAKIPEETRRGLVDALNAFTEAGGEPPVGASLDAIWA